MVVEDAILPGQAWADLIKLAGPRPWLIRGLLMLQEVSLLTGWGGLGKSMLSLCIAVFYAAGINFAPFWRIMPEVRGQSVKRRVLILAAEDKREEMYRRLAAIGTVFGIDPATVAGRIKIVTPEEGASQAVRIKLFTKSEKSVSRGSTGLRVSERKVELNVTELGRQLPRMIEEAGVDLVILDPVVEIHDVTENSNDEMSEVWKQLIGIAYDCRIAILAIHHESKSGSGELVGGGRGAAVNRDKVRVGLGMTRLTDTDFGKFGPGLTIDGAVLARSAEDPEAPATQRNLYRLTLGKMNYGASADDYFFRMVAVDAGLVDASGETELIGVPVPMTYREPMVRAFDIYEYDHLDATLDLIDQAVAEGNPLSAGKSRHSLREEIRKTFGPEGPSGLKVADGVIDAMRSEGLIEQARLAAHKDRVQWVVSEGARAKVKGHRRATEEGEDAPF